MGSENRSTGSVEACSALAAAWPRALIADGNASELAAWWVSSREEAESKGLPRIPRTRLDGSIEAGLFDARRARRLSRGLDGAEALLASEEAGLNQVASSPASSGRTRISRLLIVSGDGSERFYRQVEKLRVRFSNRLEVLLIDCDDAALGAAAFGPGRRARALLLHHKEAVVRFLSILDLVDDGVPK